MKKSFAALILSFFSFLPMFTACSIIAQPQKEPPGLLLPINYDGAIQFGDFQARVNIEAESQEIFLLTYLEPESIAGFSVRLENSVYTYDMEGIEIAHNEESLPSPDLAMLLFLSIQSLMKETYTNFSLTENIWTYEGIVSENIFFLTQNHETGSLIELQIPQRQLTAYFLPPSS